MLIIKRMPHFWQARQIDIKGRNISCLRTCTCLITIGPQMEWPMQAFPLPLGPRRISARDLSRTQTLKSRDGNIYCACCEPKEELSYLSVYAKVKVRSGLRVLEDGYERRQ